jgi:hypothetical protein
VPAAGFDSCAETNIAAASSIDKTQTALTMGTSRDTGK